MADPFRLESVVDRVLRAVCGVTDKPPLGPAPPYAEMPAPRINGLDRIDIQVLRLAGLEAVRDSGTRSTTAEFVASTVDELSITEAQVVESIEVLDSLGMVEIHRTLGPGLPSIRRFDLTDEGFETHLRTNDAAYPEIERSVIARLAGWPEEHGSERQISDAVASRGRSTRRRRGVGAGACLRTRTRCA